MAGLLEEIHIFFSDPKTNTKELFGKIFPKMKCNDCGNKEDINELEWCICGFKCCYDCIYKHYHLCGACSGCDVSYHMKHLSNCEQCNQPRCLKHDLIDFDGLGRKICWDCHCAHPKRKGCTCDYEYM